MLKLEEQGQPIRAGLVGCGQMGSGLVHVTHRMRGMETVAIADLDPGRPIAVLRRLGIPTERIIVTNRLCEAEDALRAGAYLITEDALLLTQLELLDGIIEATGVPEMGARVAWTGIEHRKHIIMLNVETDVTIGVLLDRKARQAGCVYSVAAGDEPAVCKMLYDFARTIGFDVVCLGKGKNNPINHAVTPEMCRDEAARKGMNPKMLASFIDGTKTMVEMAAVSNATGLLPDVPGMHGPKAELDELRQILIPKTDGGILSKKGCVEYSTGRIAPGVFAIVTTDEPEVIRNMQFVSMGEGPYYLFFRPFHLCSLETPIALAEAVLYGEATVTAESMHAEVVSIAKRDLKAGERIGGIGSADIFNRIYTYADARRHQAIPMGIAGGGMARVDIGKGSMLTEDNFAADSATEIYRLRKMQDALLERSIVD